MPILDQGRVNDFKTPKNSIPSEGDVMVKSIIYDIDFTGAAKKTAAEQNRKPTLEDGLAVKFVHTHYWGPDKKERQLLVYENAKTAADVKFPCDILNADGTVSYCWITNEEYLNVNRITSKFGFYGGYMKPVNDAEFLLVYDSSMCAQLGVPSGTILDVMLNLNLTEVSDEELAQLGIGRPTEKKFPVLNMYRYRETWASKKEPGKTDWKVILQGYNKTSGANDLKDLALEWITDETNSAIYEAIADRNVRKNEKDPF